MSKNLNRYLSLGALLLVALAAHAQQAMTNGMSAQVSAAWTSATASGASGARLVVPMATTEPFVTTGGYTTAVFSFTVGGSLSGGVISFEATNALDANSGWQAISCYRIGAIPSADTTYTLTGANQIWQCPAAGTLAISARLSTAITGTGTANLVAQATTAPAGTTFAYIPVDQPQLTTPLNVQVAPTTAGGVSTFDNAGATIGTTVVSVKASAGNLYGWHLFNASTAACYLQIFNTASGSVTLGTTPPVLAVGMNTLVASDNTPALPISFSTAISIAATTTATGSTVCPTSSGIVGNLLFN